MRALVEMVWVMLRDRWEVEDPWHPEKGAEIVQLVILVAAFAALALATVAAISLLVNNKVAGISLD